MTVTLPDLARVPAGSFLMGSDEGDEHERPARLVTLDVFLIGVCQVTNAEYERFVRTTARRPPGVDDLPAIVRPAQEGYFRELASAYRWHHGEPPAGKADHPVVLVTHEDARAYCHWLADQSGSPFRLPTEAEWEKAARGGREAARYPWGDHIDSTLASFLPHASMKPKMGTGPVRACPPNGYGLYGMSGNVWEWVSDWYRSDYYAASDPHNPTGPITGTLRVLRGGAWTNEDVRYLRCAQRLPVPADTFAYSIGFRVACSTRP
jgi:formylglycine-generating enzyme required for sulfatase activity